MSQTSERAQPNGVIVRFMEHGTLSMYVNRKCRCEPCREARKEYDRSRKKTQRVNRPYAVHGTRAMYNKGCRCDQCRASQREYRQRRRKNGAPEHGTVNGYVNHGCKCKRCKKAGQIENNRRAEERKSFVNPEGVSEHPRVTHGTHSGYYTYYCRCQPCIDAGAEYRRVKVS